MKMAEMAARLEREARMQVCNCGKPTAQTGHAVVYDPLAKHWTLIVWPVFAPPTPPQKIKVYGIQKVQGCPRCLLKADFEHSVGWDELPKEAQDHLLKLRADNGKPNPVSVPVNALDLSEIPEPEEV